MKIEKGNYIRAAEFSNEEIDVFIGLTGIDVNDSDNDSEKRYMNKAVATKWSIEEQ